MFPSVPTKTPFSPLFPSIAGGMPFPSPAEDLLSAEAVSRPSSSPNLAQKPEAREINPLNLSAKKSRKEKLSFRG
jgi:hypothetical protein